MSWSNRKYKITKSQPAKRICDMDRQEAQRMKDYAFQMSNAAGYADEAGLQNHWIGVEGECKERIRQIESTAN